MVTLDKISEQLLNDIFLAFLKAPNGLNAPRFRADNQQFLSEIDRLERSNFIQRKDDVYLITPLTLAQLSQQNPEAQELVRVCSLIFAFLRGSYIDNLNQRVTIPDLLRGTGLPENDIRMAYRIIIQMPILGGYSGNPNKADASVEPSENILRYSSFEDLLRQMQEWAEKQHNRPPESVKPDKESPKYPVEQSLSLRESKAIWKDIENDFDITKRSFGRKINFVSDGFKRRILFRDVEQAFILASLGFSKPAVILAGGVIEELLRLYLRHKSITPINDSFDGYIQTCEQKGILKAGISRLSDSARHFRNLVHLSKEETKRHTISKATAIGAVSSIFTIANDF